MKLNPPQVSKMSRPAMLGGVASALILTSASSDAVVLYSQPFDAGSPANLHGTTVAGGTLSTSIWNANTGYQTDGTLSALTRSMALLSFTPETDKVYELSMTVGNLESGFIGIGFADNVSFAGGNANGDRMITGNAINYGMMFLNPFQLATNGMAYSTYSSGANIMDSNVFLGDPADGPTPPTAGPGPYTIKIVMDTRNEDWTTRYFVDNVSVRFFTHDGALTSIDSVGINTGLATTDTTFSNFQLQIIPEPRAALLGGLGLLALLRRRRN